MAGSKNHRVLAKVIHWYIPDYLKKSNYYYQERSIFSSMAVVVFF